MRSSRILVPIAAALLAACSAITGSRTHEQTLHVASYTRTCQGVGEMQCMLVREDADGEWLNFYNAIEGFTWEAGYDYVLIVGWRSPPWDARGRGRRWESGPDRSGRNGEKPHA